MTEERRQHPRRHVLQRGQIVFLNGHSNVDCIVMDLSDGGARLKMSEWLHVPEEFELRMENGHNRDVRIRHQDMDRAGVAFVA